MDLRGNLSPLRCILCKVDKWHFICMSSCLGNNCVVKLPCPGPTSRMTMSPSLYFVTIALIEVFCEHKVPRLFCPRCLVNVCDFVKDMRGFCSRPLIEITSVPGSRLITLRKDANQCLKKRARWRGTALLSQQRTRWLTAPLDMGVVFTMSLQNISTNPPI
jgi:hypothetical protein